MATNSNRVKFCVWAGCWEPRLPNSPLCYEHEQSSKATLRKALGKPRPPRPEREASEREAS